MAGAVPPIYRISEEHPMLETMGIDTPEDELKRADHLVYVSLKYTRTCDIMKNGMKRMIAAFELSFDQLLEYEKEKKRIDEIPGSMKEKSAAVRPFLGNHGKKFLTLYNLLKKIDKAEYDASEEFRKNVMLKTKTTKPISVKMENLYNFLEATKEFVVFTRQKMKE
ncbi:hypothetical protein HZB00_02690 [Candidatus Woesearchaeota archaeon]|nr:hypothetical protein [Candidatus Woesearchaeota archaeon]